jgi:hypothetical protein
MFKSDIKSNDNYKRISLFWFIAHIEIKYSEMTFGRALSIASKSHNEFVQSIDKFVKAGKIPPQPELSTFGGN